MEEHYLQIKPDEEHYLQIKPEKAHGAFPKKFDPWVDPDWVAEPKIDGERILEHFGRGLPRVHMTSKGISKITGRYGEKAENVPALWVPEEHRVKLDYTVLDMEIVHAVNTHSVLGSGPEKALAYQEKHGPAFQHIFDLLFLDGEDIRHKVLKIRRALLAQLLNTLEIPNSVLVPQIVGGRREYYDAQVASGGEGVVLKNLYGPYYNGRWIKVKTEIQISVIITGYTEGTNSNVGMVGSLCVSVFEGKELVEIGRAGGLSGKNRAMISADRQKFLGRVLDVKAQTLTKKTDSFLVGGRLRHPRVVTRKDKTLRFRDDVNLEECTGSAVRREFNVKEAVHG